MNAYVFVKLALTEKKLLSSLLTKGNEGTF